MIKGLLKLEIIIFTLSLAFIGLSCGKNTTGGSGVNGKDLLEGKVNFGGYYLSTYEDGSRGYLTFEKGNQLKARFVDSNWKEEDVYTITKVTSEEEDTYDITLKMTSAKYTPLTTNWAQQLNNNSFYGYNDWEKNATKELISEVGSNKKNDTMTLTLTDDKNSLGYILGSGDGTTLVVGTYHK